MFNSLPDLFWNQGVTKFAFSIILTDSPLDPLVSSQDDRISLPEKLQDIVTQLYHKEILKFNHFLRISIRIKCHHNILTLVFLQLLKAQLQNIPLLLQRFRQFLQL